MEILVVRGSGITAAQKEIVVVNLCRYLLVFEFYSFFVFLFFKKCERIYIVSFYVSLSVNV